MTDCQLTDEIAGVDNAWLENDGVEIDGPENDGRNKTDEKWTDIDGNGVMWPERVCSSSTCDRFLGYVLDSHVLFLRSLGHGVPYRSLFKGYHKKRVR